MTPRVSRAGRRVHQSLWPGTASVKLLVGGAVSAVVVVTGLFVWFGWWAPVDRACSRNALACNLISPLIVTAAVAVVTFYLVFLRREAMAAASWRRQAKNRPEQLFSWLPPIGGPTGLAARKPSRWLGRRRPAGSPGTGRHAAVSLVDDVLSRKHLVRDLASDLDEGSNPQVIVGPTGSGKTTVLLKLTRHLARRGQVPMAISMRELNRSAAQIDLEDLAYGKFRERLPNRTDEEAEKLWRWLRRGSLITLIVDDLEKAKREPALVMQALEATARAGLRVVAASRPSGVPPDLRAGRVDLEPLHEEDVTGDLRTRLRASRTRAPAERASEADVLAVVRAADVTHTPYYLALARVLADTGELWRVSSAEAGNAQLALLSGYRRALETRRVRPDAGVSEDMRRRVFLDLEAVAFVRLRGAKRNEDVTQALLELDLEPDLRLIVDCAQRLGVLEPRIDGSVRFGHPTTFAYFAACFLARRKRDDELWQSLLGAGRITSTTGLTLVLASAHTPEDPERAKATCDALLGPAPADGGAGNRKPSSEPDYDRLLRLEAAAAIAQHAADCRPLVESAVVATIGQGRPTTQLSRERIRLMKLTSELFSARGHMELWNVATTAPEYQVRREATKLLLRAGAEAAEASLPRIRQAIQAADGYRDTHEIPVETDRGKPFEELRAAGWMLPGLRSVCANDVRAELDRHQERLLEHARTLTRQRGLEASVAQGLKLDAVLHPECPPDVTALEMLEPGHNRAQFWFSRVQLLQAVTLRSVGGRAGERARRVVSDGQGDEHPFVREAARLCVRALDSRHWQRYIWEDMTEIAADGRAKLATVTKQLIADIVLALNLNDLGDDRARIRFGQSSALPACLGRSYHRLEILGWTEPSEACAFRDGDGCLCPYTYHGPAEGIRRELSRAFCRDQRLHAQRLPWHSKVRVRELKAFWREMESLARF